MYLVILRPNRSKDHYGCRSLRPARSFLTAKGADQSLCPPQTLHKGCSHDARQRCLSKSSSLKPLSLYTPEEKWQGLLTNCKTMRCCQTYFVLVVVSRFLKQRRKECIVTNSRQLTDVERLPVTNCNGNEIGSFLFEELLSQLNQL